MKENSVKVLKFLQKEQAAGNKHYADTIAAALGIDDIRVINGCLTGLFRTCKNRPSLGERVEKEIQLADGTHKTVKLAVLNDDGMKYDPAVEEAKGE